jgi:hypothetical protein
MAIADVFVSENLEFVKAWPAGERGWNKRIEFPARKAEALADEARKRLCAYCDKPTRQGSMLLDEGQTAHRSCYREFGGAE